MIWRNGRILDETPACVPPSEVNGVFTTVGCDDGRPLLWDRHHRRLHANAAEVIGIAAPALPTREELAALLRECQCVGPARLRVVVWEDLDGGVTVEAACAPAPATGPGQDPVWLGIVTWADPPPAGCKLVDRSRWAEAGTRARAWGADEALVIDGDDRVLECPTANVFVRRGSVVATPAAPERCLPGVLRERLLELLPSIKLRSEERDIHRDELAFADEVWITNSVRGVVRVGRLGERRWDRWDFFARLEALQIQAPGW